MFSRKHRRMLTLSLMLAAGSLALPPAQAQAAPARSGPSHAGSVVQTDLFTRSLIETVKNLWELLKDAPPGPPRGDDPHRHDPHGDEGPSVCPHGG